MFERGQFFENSLEKQLLAHALNNSVEVIYKNSVNSADIIAIGPEKINANIFGYGRIYDGIINDAILFYNNDYAPKGYVCVLPSKDKFQILSVSFDRNEFATLEKRFEKAIEQNKILKDLINDNKFIRNIGGIGNYFINPVGYKNGKYYVGEAGGFQDASRGFGVWYAILTGYMAAQSIIEKKDYNKTWRKELLKELNDSIKRRDAFNKLNNKDFDDMVRNMGQEITLKSYKKQRKA